MSQLLRKGHFGGGGAPLEGNHRLETENEGGVVGVLSHVQVDSLPLQGQLVGLNQVN